MRHNDKPTRNCPADPGQARGFTLVELMVVVLIISIIAGLAVSIGAAMLTKGKEDKTRALLRLVGQAIAVYYEATGAYPGYPTDMPYPPPKNSTMDYDKEKVFLPTHYLLTDLQSVPAARSKLVNLPEGSMILDSADPTKGYLHDAYEAEVLYSPEGGNNNAPVLFSGGPDRTYSGDEPEEFNGSPIYFYVIDPTSSKDKDNIKYSLGE